MRTIDSISCNINYYLTPVQEKVQKVSIYTSIIKKTSQLFNKLSSAVDLYKEGKTRDRTVNKISSGISNIIDFFSTYKNVMYWVNLFSKENLDKETLKTSIETSIQKVHGEAADIDKIVQEVYSEVMAVEKYHGKIEVLRAVKLSLRKHENAEDVEAIAKNIIIRQKTRPLVQRIYMVCFTLADLGGNLVTLKEWKILDLSFLAVSIGKQSRVCMFVVNLGVDTVLGTIATAGIILALGDTTAQLVVHALKYIQTADLHEQATAGRKIRDLLFEIAAATTDLIYTAAPLVFTLTPSVKVTLAIIAKGTGEVALLYKFFKPKN